MRNNDDAIMTDEELDGLVGGASKVYKYQLCTHPTKGNYYRCYIFTDGIQTGTRNIGEDKWELFKETITKNGYSYEKLK